MKEYSTESIRNVALVSHSSAGKTMLAETFLHYTGAITRLGKIEDGTTVSDFDDEEKRRTISLYSTVIPVEYKDTKINVLDTPGYNDFVGDVISALSVSDGAVVLVDSVSGREVGTEITWKYLEKFNLPRIVVINKMNRENSDFKKAMASMQDYTDKRLIQVQIPWGEKLDYKGVIDILTMKAYAGNDKNGVEITRQDYPVMLPRMSYARTSDGGRIISVRAVQPTKAHCSMTERLGASPSYTIRRRPEKL